MRHISTAGTNPKSPHSCAAARTAEPSPGISMPSSGTVVGSEQTTAGQQMRSASKYEAERYMDESRRVQVPEPWPPAANGFAGMGQEHRTGGASFFFFFGVEWRPDLT
nr:unnamed protein product [Digitaria exilis]